MIRARPRRQNLLHTLHRARTNARHFLQQAPLQQLRHRRVLLLDDPRRVAKRARAMGVAALNGQQVAHLGKHSSNRNVVHTPTVLVAPCGRQFVATLATVRLIERIRVYPGVCAAPTTTGSVPP